MKKSQHRHRARRRLREARSHATIWRMINAWDYRGCFWSFVPRTHYWLDQGTVLHQIPPTPPVWPRGVTDA